MEKYMDTDDVECTRQTLEAIYFHNLNQGDSHETRET